MPVAGLDEVGRGGLHPGLAVSVHADASSAHNSRRKSRLSECHETDSLEHCSGCGGAWSAGSASAQALEGKWTNPKRSVIVNVARCGSAYCGTVSWASEKTRDKVAENGRKLVGTRILSDLRPAGDGLYKGRAFEPKRNIRGSATVRQVGPNVMVVKGCAVARHVLQGAALDARQLAPRVPLLFRS